MASHGTARRWRRVRGLHMLATLMALATFACALPAYASNVELFGLGARGGAMAGVVAASPSGYSAAYYNPAGLAFETHPSFSLGIQSAHYGLELDGDEHPVDTAPSMTIGVSVPIPFGGFLERRITIAMGFVLPLTSLLTADVPGPALPRFSVLENRAQTVSIQACAGVRVADWLAVGGGALVLAELIGAIDVGPNDTGRIGASVRDEVVSDYAPFAGVLVRPTDWLGVSAAYRGRSDARFELPITVSLGQGFDIPIPLLDITGTAQYDPRQVAVDVAASHGWFLGGVGATWKQWSAYRNPIVYTAVPEDFPEQPPAGFSDTVALRAGVEGTFSLPGGWAAAPRLGYAWEPTPAPEQTGMHNYLDNDRSVISAGCEIRYQNLKAETAAQLHVVHEGRFEKDPVLLAEQMPGPVEENPGFPGGRFGGTVLFWIFELGAEF